MVKRLFFCLCFISFFSVQSQDFGELEFHSTFEEVHFLESNDYIAQFLMSDPLVDSDEYIGVKSNLDSYIETLKAKRSKTKKEIDFVSQVFYKTHRKYLKRYSSFTSLATLMSTGKYDCLSATSLYSHLFTQLDIKHSIIETNYHIYIKVTTSEGEVLVESTDPIYGFVVNSKEIHSRLNEISSENVLPSETDSYHFLSQVNDEISSSELIGLMYYNQAVAAFNSQEYKASINFLTKGLIYRSNARSIEFGLVVAQAIMQDENLEQDKKLFYVSKLQRMLHNTEALASR